MARTQASDKKGKPKGGSKAQSSSAAAAATPTSARVAKPMTGTNGDFAALVRELGGDEDDLKLLAGVDSDDEGGEVIYSGNAPNEVRSTPARARTPRASVARCVRAAPS